MDNRTLIAFGMLLALVAFALQKRAVDGVAVEKIVTFLSGGITGAMIPRGPGDTGKAVARAAAIFLLAGAALFLMSCMGTASPPDPTAPAPSVVLPRDPLAPPFTTFYQHADGGTDR